MSNSICSLGSKEIFWWFYRMTKMELSEQMLAYEFLFVKYGISSFCWYIFFKTFDFRSHR